MGMGQENGPLEWMKQGINFGLGLAVVSREQVEKWGNELVKKGEISQSQSKEWVDRLVKRGEEQRKELGDWMNHRLEERFKQIGFPTPAEISRLEERMNRLEAKMNEIEVLKEELRLLKKKTGSPES